MKVMWERSASIEFWVGARWVAQSGSPPLVVRVGVMAGKKYPLLVADAAPWDYGDFVVPYVLTTTIEHPRH